MALKVVCAPAIMEFGVSVTPLLMTAHLETKDKGKASSTLARTWTEWLQNMIEVITIHCHITCLLLHRPL